MLLCLAPVVRGLFIGRHMEKHFMIDIETTGVDQRNDVILEIGILECDFDTDKGLWKPGRSLQFASYTSREPETPFALTHQKELYERCKRADVIDSRKGRKKVTGFFQECGALAPNVFLMGWNASNFDVPFLVNAGWLMPSRYETVNGVEVMIGDFHYRIYELGGAIAFAADVKKWTRGDVIEAAKGVDSGFDMPEGKEHDALFDCYNQLKILNGLITLVRG